MKTENCMEINLVAENMKLHKINWYKAINTNWWAHIKSILSIHKQDITEKSILTIHKKEIQTNIRESKDVHEASSPLHNN